MQDVGLNCHRNDLKLPCESRQDQETTEEEVEVLEEEKLTPMKQRFKPITFGQFNNPIAKKKRRPFNQSQENSFAQLCQKKKVAILNKIEKYQSQERYKPRVKRN